MKRKERYKSKGYFEFPTISQKDLENSLVDMFLDSAAESFELGNLKDADDYVRAVASVYPNNQKAIVYSETYLAGE